MYKLERNVCPVGGIFRRVRLRERFAEHAAATRAELADGAAFETADQAPSCQLM